MHTRVDHCVFNFAKDFQPSVLESFIRIYVIINRRCAELESRKNHVTFSDVTDNRYDSFRNGIHNAVALLRKFHRSVSAFRSNVTVYGIKAATRDAISQYSANNTALFTITRILIRY